MPTQVIHDQKPFARGTVEAFAAELGKSPEALIDTLKVDGRNLP